MARGSLWRWAALADWAPLTQCVCGFRRGPGGKHHRYGSCAGGDAPLICWHLIPQYPHGLRGAGSLPAPLNINRSTFAPRLTRNPGSSCQPPTLSSQHTLRCSRRTRVPSQGPQEVLRNRATEERGWTPSLKEPWPHPVAMRAAGSTNGLQLPHVSSYGRQSFIRSSYPSPKTLKQHPLPSLALLWFGI